jgi:predicted DNA-binding ribbon-helix-helix protein
METVMARQKKDGTLTSISLDTTLYRQFKKQAIEDNITLTALVTKAINTYLTGSLNEKALSQISSELQEAFNRL